MGASPLSTQSVRKLWGPEDLFLGQFLKLIILLCCVLPVPDAKSPRKMHAMFVYVHYS